MAIPVIAAGDVVQIRQVAKNSNQYGLNLLKFVAQNPIGAPVGPDDVATYYDTNCNVVFKALLSSAATYWGYSARILNRPTTPEFYQDLNRGAGTSGANLLPTQSAPLISWRTDVAGRQGRGRSYLPFAASSALNADGSLTNAFKIAIAAWSAVTTGVITVQNAAATGAIDLVFSVVDRLLLRKTPIVRNIIRLYCASQRRREELNRADADPFNGCIHA